MNTRQLRGTTILIVSLTNPLEQAIFNGKRGRSSWDRAWHDEVSCGQGYSDVVRGSPASTSFDRALVLSNPFRPDLATGQ